jgi:hypothetical protein
MAFGIPTSEKVYLSNRNDVKGRFAKAFDSWPKYRNQVIQPYERVALRASRMGVRIVQDITLEKFGELFFERKVHIVILFSHWSDDAVEFHDGFMDCDLVIERVPFEYGGIIDLCVCHPEKLVRQLREMRPNCFIKWIDAKATPAIWLYFYAALFSYLKRGKKCYLEVLEELIIVQLEQSRIYRKEPQ